MVLIRMNLVSVVIIMGILIAIIMEICKLQEANKNLIQLR